MLGFYTSSNTAVLFILENWATDRMRKAIDPELNVTFIVRMLRNLLSCGYPSKKGDGWIPKLVWVLLRKIFCPGENRATILQLFSKYPIQYIDKVISGPFYSAQYKINLNKSLSCDE